MSLAARMHMHSRNFEKGTYENPRFWRRLGGAPDLRGKRVLDLGCGLGSLCVHVAALGAAEVVGVDLDEENIEFARQNVHRRFPELADRIHFMCQDVRTLEGPQFDYVISKDAFEHILDLPSVLAAVVRLVKPGGRIFIALGPLYHSPLGDHGRLGLRIPWGHVLIPERWLLAHLNARRGTHFRSVEELGLNKYTVQEFRAIFETCGAKIVFYKENHTERSIAKVVSLLRKVRWLECFLTWNIYCVLQKN